MKIIRIFMIFLMLAVSVNAIAADKEFDNIDELIKAKKYQSAAEALLKDGQIKENPEIFLKYVKVVTDYYVHTINFKLFAMRDLKPEESIEVVRGVEGKFTIVGGDLENDLKEMEQRYPENKFVKFAIGYYISKALSCGCADD